MGLFDKKVEADADGYFPATAVSTIQDEEITAVNINGTKLILLRWQDEIHAMSGKCPHAAANMAEGDCYRGKVVCPDHGYVFEIATGRTLWPADEMLRLKRYPVKVENGLVLVKVENK
jgi:nitrite reductase/ring-hydroxylating ferredoxin subunit